MLRTCTRVHTRVLLLERRASCPQDCAGFSWLILVSTPSARRWDQGRRQLSRTHRRSRTPQQHMYKWASSHFVTQPTHARLCVRVLLWICVCDATGTHRSRRPTVSPGTRWVTGGDLCHPSSFSTVCCKPSARPTETGLLLPKTRARFMYWRPRWVAADVRRLRGGEELCSESSSL